MRTQLRNRRPHLNETLRWGNVAYDVGFGFDETGKVREVFMSGAKVGSEMDGLLADLGVLASLLLQYGPTAADVHGHLGREPAAPGDAAASIIGLVMARAAELEAEAGAGVAVNYGIPRRG